MEEKIEKKQKKLSYKQMGLILNKCSKANMGKAVFSLLLYMLIQGALYIAAMIPSMGMLSENSSMFSAVFPLLFFFAANIISCTLIYGLFTIFSRMLEQRRVTIGFLFAGFKKDKRIFKSAIIYTLITTICAFVTSILMIVLKIPFSFDPSAADPVTILKSVAPLFVIFFVLMFVTLLPFVFVYFILNIDKDIKVFKAFGKSAGLLFKNLFRFIGFVLYAGGVYLAAFVAINVLTLFVNENSSIGLQTFSSLISIFGIIAEYISLVRIMMAVPLYFYSAIGAIRMEKPQTEKEETVLIPENVSEKNEFSLPEDTSEQNKSSSQEN